ncbi:MAG TPA: glycoside hydrolase family 38 C-terminal domain-containing protein [Acidobacteriaceae bacterium]|jgi:alpha-mannosidase|nr:glycoside hydrolase family 38 C-terminal domain-containing protein [Acidobacteriaceae bacterium]
MVFSGSVAFRTWLQIALAALVGCGATQAQFLQRDSSAAQGLPAAERDTLDRLGNLGHLPSGIWHYHAGDVAHAEDPTLDDSAWPVAKANSVYPADALWFRQWIQVPTTLNGYDLTGARIWFRFDAWVNGSLPQIVYFNGRRVAMGEDLEPVVLFDNARPGDRVLVAVKLQATVDQKHFVGTPMEITFAASRPSPQDMREEFLSAALLIPSLSTNQSADQATLDKAINQVDLKSLDAADQPTFDASLRASQSTLEALKPMMNRATLHLTGNSHIDAAWLWPWTETVDTVKNTFGTALQLMNEYPTYTYTQSAADYNDWMARDYPLINDQIKKRIQQGRWEVVGGMWIEPDLNMPDGESTARSLLIGKRWFQQHYGVDVRIGWNPDSFGYNWQLPQIYKKSGIDYFVTQKMAWNDTNHLPFKLFWWESPDGSKVLTYFPHDYANTNLNPVRLSADLAQAITYAPGLTNMLDLYGVGDHGGGPTRSMLDEGLHWMQPDKVVPKMEFGTAQPWFTETEKQIAPDSKTWDYRSIADGYQLPPPVPGQISIPTWKSELYFEYHRGVFTTQAGMKRNLREAPEWTLNAEKEASLAWLDGADYPGDALTEAWKKITFNDFHDLAAGSGIGVIYQDAQKDFDDVRWSTNEISADAMHTIDAHIDTHVAAGVPVLVFNPLAWTRSGNATVDVQMPSAASDVSVIDANGAVLPSEVLSKNAATGSFHLLVDVHNVPSLGYEVLRVVAGKRPFPTDLHVKGTTLENAALRVVVDPRTGCITSLYDKKAAFETLAAGSCGNELQAFKDTPKDYDAWNIDPGTLDVPPAKLDDADSVEVVEKGPLRGAIRVTRHWQNSKFEQEIILEEGADQAVVVNDIDWHETHVLLKAAFALAATSPFATYEIPYGTIERPTTRNNSWEKAQFEVGAQRWADEGNGEHGFSLINDSKYGYDGVGNLLRLTLLRSPVWPDPNADRGHQHFTYALYPHAGDWKQAMTVRHGYDYNFPLAAMQVEAHTGALPAQHSFVAATPDDVVLTAMKKAEDSHALVFHLYEWAGKSGNIELRVPPGATAAVETNLMEQPQGDPLPLAGDRVTIPVHPYEIVAVRVDYPETEAAKAGR